MPALCQPVGPARQQHLQPDAISVGHVEPPDSPVAPQRNGHATVVEAWRATDSGGGPRQRLQGRRGFCAPAQHG